MNLWDLSEDQPIFKQCKHKADEKGELKDAIQEKDVTNKEVLLLVAKTPHPQTITQTNFWKKPLINNLQITLNGKVTWISMVLTAPKSSSSLASLVVHFVFCNTG